MVEDTRTEEGAKRRRIRGGIIIGLVLIGLGAVLLADNFFPGLGFGKLWPAIVIIWGFGVFVSGFFSPFSVDRLLRGVFIGTIGVVLLYNTFGIVPYDFWLDLITLWPVLLIAVGFAILGGVTRLKVISALSSVVIISTIIIALVFRGAIFQERGLTKAEFSREMITGVKSGIAKIDFTTGSLDIGDTGEFYDIETKESFAEDEPNISYRRSGSSAELRLKTPKDERLYLGKRQRKWNVFLSRDIDWQLDVNIGVSDSDLDLKNLKVTKLDLDGGVSDITIRFGSRVGTINADINSGVSKLKLLVPKSSGVRLTMNKGISARDFENINLRSLSGDDKIKYETPGFDRATKRITLDIDIGISSLVVEGY